MRRPTDEILRRFAAGGRRLVLLWYAFASPFGLLAGIVQVVGLLRWPFLVPHLAGAYVAPGASQASREATLVTFASAHRFLVPDLLALAGIVPTAAILVGLLEPAGWRPAGAINAIGYLVWSLWLIALGIALLLP